MIGRRSYLNFITLFAVIIFGAARLQILEVTVRLAGAIRALRARLDVSLRHTFVAVERLPVLTQKRIFAVGRAVEVRAAVQVVVLVISVFLRVARVGI